MANGLLSSHAAAATALNSAVDGVPLDNRYGQPRDRFVEITPEVLLKAYACGIFPMAESADDPGAVLDRAGRARRHPARTASTSRRGSPARCARTASISRVNHDFDARARRLRRAGARAARAPGSTRASARSIASSIDIGHCHSVEAYEDGALVGGLYGVWLGRAFFGESMFHRARDASKVALVHLVARLKAGGFQLLDTQFVTDHLKIFRRDRSAEAGTITSCWKRRWSAKRTSTRCRSTAAERRTRRSASLPVHVKNSADD